MNEIKIVLNNVLKQLAQHHQAINGLDAALSRYIDFKGDKDPWMSWIKEQADKEANESKPKKSRENTGGDGDSKSGK